MDDLVTWQNPLKGSKGLAITDESSKPLLYLQNVEILIFSKLKICHPFNLIQVMEARHEDNINKPSKWFSCNASNCNGTLNQAVKYTPDIHCLDFKCLKDWRKVQFRNFQKCYVLILDCQKDDTTCLRQTRALWHTYGKAGTTTSARHDANEITGNRYWYAKHI